ncbi:MAG: iron-sulfur cluster assembly accessory protein [Chromatiales bacterium]|nr:iron-sulfur cluster assembly accessory protein [Chromatiales bacterium]
MQTAQVSPVSSSPVFETRLGDEDIAITPAAADKLAELFREVDDGDIEAVRIFVTGGGCGGMSYGMTFTDSRNEHDAVLEGEGYKVYVDAVALNFLRGVEIDFVDRGMGQASFVFNNVFAAVGGSGGCSACGSSGGGCG